MRSKAEEAKLIAIDLFKECVIPFIGGIVLFFIILGLVFATGSTFGQKCAAKGYEVGSDKWAQCVEYLHNGTTNEKV